MFPMGQRIPRRAIYSVIPAQAGMTRATKGIQLRARGKRAKVRITPNG